MTERSYYDILQVTPAADLEVIQSAYRVLARKYHPDRSLSPSAAARMGELNQAYNVLKNPATRAAYDLARAREAAARRDLESRRPILRNPPAPPPPAPVQQAGARPDERWRRGLRVACLAGAGAGLVVLGLVLFAIVPRGGSERSAATEQGVTPRPLPQGLTAALTLAGQSGPAGVLTSSVVDTRAEAGTVELKVRLDNRSSMDVPLGEADFTLQGAVPPVPSRRPDLPPVLRPGESAEAWLAFSATDAPALVWCPRASPGACIRF